MLHSSGTLYKINSREKDSHDEYFFPFNLISSIFEFYYIAFNSTIMIPMRPYRLCYFGAIEKRNIGKEQFIAFITLIVFTILTTLIPTALISITFNLIIFILILVYPHLQNQNYHHCKIKNIIKSIITNSSFILFFKSLQN